MIMDKPKGRALAIKEGTGEALIIETLTDEAHEWLMIHGREFGQFIPSTEDRPQRRYLVFVHLGYDRMEVKNYLEQAWEEAQWPVELEEITPKPDAPA